MNISTASWIIFAILVNLLACTSNEINDDKILNISTTLFMNMLNRAEVELDETFHSSSRSSSDIIAHYEALLEFYRDNLQSFEYMNYMSRFSHLGKLLCRNARQSLQPLRPSDIDSSAEYMPEAEKTTQIWDSFLEDLVDHMTKDNYCDNFYLYYYNQWNPTFFHWPMIIRDTCLELLIRDDRWLDIWKFPILNGINYAYKLVDNEIFDNTLPGHPIRVERTQHVYHIFSLFYGSDLHELGGMNFLTQVIEFGGGTGDMAASFRDMNYKGTYIILDLEPVLLLQQYFHRFSGIPAYLVRNPSSSELNDDDTISAANGIMSLSHSQSSSIASELYKAERASRRGQRTHLATLNTIPYVFSHILDDHKDSSSPDLDYFANTTLFMATWSLGESPLNIRKEVLTHIMRYKPGYILLTFADIFDSISNLDWMQNELLNLFIDNAYSMCWYKMSKLTYISNDATFKFSDQSYVIASKITPKRIYSYCDKRAGCTDDTKVLGINCVHR
jgi:hypothetical protein